MLCVYYSDNFNLKMKWLIYIIDYINLALCS